MELMGRLGSQICEGLAVPVLTSVQLGHVWKLIDKGTVWTNNAFFMKRIFVSVTVAALAGLVMGGLFGLGAGSITPEFFRHIVPWHDVEPVGFATFCGATAGVVLGGGLGCFAVLLQALAGKKQTADETGVK